MYNLKLSLFKHGKSQKRGWDISIDKLAEKTKSSLELIKQTEEARQFLTQKKLAEERGDQEAAKMYEEKYRELKTSRLPLITVHAYFSDGRKNGDPHKFIGVILGDIDHASEEQLSELEEKQKERPYILFGCRSVSGEGYHFLIPVKVEGGIDNANFKDVFNVTTRYVEVDMGITLDKAVGSISRCMFLNHDERVYYNPDAQPLDVTSGVWLEQNFDVEFFNMRTMTEKDRLLSYMDVADQHLNWSKGNRHRSLVSLASSVNKSGFSEEVVIDVCTQRYAEADFDATEIEKTVHDVYNRYSSEHGVNRKSFTSQRDKRTSGQVVDGRSQQTDLRDVLDEDEVLITPCPDVETLRPYIPDFLFDYVVDPNSSKEVQFAAVMGLLVASGTMMQATCWLGKGEEVSPYLYFVTIGEAASGKSCIKNAADLFRFYADPIEQASKSRKEERDAEIKAWKKCVKNCKEEDCGCGDEPVKIEKTYVLCISPNTSQSKLIDRLSTNETYPTLIYTTELDFKMEFKEMPLSAALRALYEGESISTHSHLHGDIMVVHPKGSLLVAGTPGQTVRFFGNKEDGLVSRVLPMALPESLYRPLSRAVDINEEMEREKRIALPGKVQDYASYVGQIQTLRLTDTDRILLDNYFSQLDARYAQYASSPLKSFYRRLRGMVVRMAMILTANVLYREKASQLLPHYIPEEVIKLLLSYCDFFIEQHIRLLDTLPDAQVKDAGSELVHASIFNSLSCNFETSDVYKKFKDNNMSGRTARRAIKKWENAGLIERVQSKGKYRKVHCNETTYQPLRVA